MKRLFLILIIINLLACQKDRDIFIPDLQDPIILVNTSVGGAVIDENNAPVMGATVQLGTETKETDQNGVFLFRDVEVNSSRVYLEVNKAGYFQGSRAILPQSENINVVRVKLLTNEEIGTIAAAAGGDLVLPSGTVITFPLNGFGGANASSDIPIAVAQLDPTSTDFVWTMPGDLLGLNANEIEQLLTSFGILNLEARNDNGQSIDIADGKEITLKLPIDPNLIDVAPTTIPLWYFDQDQGIWKEEGRAQLTEAAYVGKVNKIGIWNFASASDLIKIQGKVVDSQGEPLSSIRINISSSDNLAIQSSWTDSRGNYNGKVPVNKPLDLQIIDECGNPAIDESIGPFNADTNIAELTIDNGNLLRTISGKVYDCEHRSLDNAYIKLDIGSSFEIYYAEPDGRFTASFISCSSEDEVQLTGVNLNNFKQSHSFSFTEGSTINAGNVLACNEIEEYISFTLDGTAFLNKEAFAVKDANGEQTNFGAETNDSNILMSAIGGAGIGNFNIDQLTVNSLSSTQGVLPNVTVTFTAYGAVGEYITGTFGGDFTDTAGTDHVVSGSFRIQRDN